MDANRFAKFRHSLFLVYGFLKERDEKGQVEKVFNWLAQEFPELEEAFPSAEEAKALASKFEALSLQTPPSVEKKKGGKKEQRRSQGHLG